MNTITNFVLFVVLIGIFLVLFWCVGNIGRLQRKVAVLEEHQNALIHIQQHQNDLLQQWIDINYAAIRTLEIQVANLGDELELEEEILH